MKKREADEEEAHVLINRKCQIIQEKWNKKCFNSLLN